MHNFNHKKIGIWGFGVVGKSALIFFDQYNLEQITILNNKSIELPTSKNVIQIVMQDDTTIINFLENNDYVLVSPGIPLHDYQNYKHKFISELDLFYQNNVIPTIAITGSLGKTSITTLLSKILQTMNVHAVAAGNIGYPMLSLVTPALQQDSIKIDYIVLELSSFQLQQACNVAPDLAIITNLYDNHLDHHTSMQEYFDSKCNIFINQNTNQIALLPYELLNQIIQKIEIKKKWAFFSSTKLTDEEYNAISDHTVYYLDNKKIYKNQKSQIIQICDISKFQSITFDTNWLIIIAALDLQQINLELLEQVTHQLEIPDHRLQKIASWHGSDFYNDSKSTVWQATLQAINCMDSKPIKLFLGGLSKGADRTPLLQAIQGQNIEIYAFGKEADIIAQICTQLNIKHRAHATLEESFNICVSNIKIPSNILFSPAGSSYDLFDNYMQRGSVFTDLVKKHTILNNI